MARNRNVMDMLKRVPDRNAIKKPRPGGGGYRSSGGIDPQMEGTQGDLPGGQQQLGPGYQSGIEGYLDYNFGGNHPAWSSGEFGTNIQDLSVGNFDNYYDFYQWMQNLTNPNFPNESSLGGVTSSPYVSGGSMYPNWNEVNPEYGGSMGGGTGDLGTGGTFTGGGMGTSMSGGGLWEQDCSQIGPQYNMQGECIACCETQYGSAGFYGNDSSDFTPGDTTEIDPSDFAGDCYSQYQAIGGANSGMDFSQFEGLYC